MFTLDMLGITTGVGNLAIGFAGGSRHGAHTEQGTRKYLACRRGGGQIININFLIISPGGYPVVIDIRDILKAYSLRVLIIDYDRHLRIGVRRYAAEQQEKNSQNFICIIHVLSVLVLVTEAGVDTENGLVIVF